MKVCLILCFLNALTSSKKKFAQTYGKNRDINHDLCLNLSLSPIQTLQMGRRARSYAGEIKSETFNLTDISAYFRYRKEVEGDNLLSDQTYSDLGVEELFTFADRTVSRVGQQYLYQTLRSVPQAAGEISRHERSSVICRRTAIYGNGWPKHYPICATPKPTVSYDYWQTSNQPPPQTERSLLLS